MARRERHGDDSLRREQGERVEKNVNERRLTIYVYDAFGALAAQYGLGAAARCGVRDVLSERGPGGFVRGW